MSKKMTLNAGVLLLLWTGMVGEAFDLYSQHVQQVRPLPQSQWKQQKDMGDYSVGTFYEKVSTRSKLIAFYTFMDQYLQTRDPWNIRFYAPEKDRPLVILEEKRPIEYVRLESSSKLSIDEGWRDLSQWTTDTFSIPPENLGVLVQYPSNAHEAFFVPAIVYQNELPKRIHLYRAAILADGDLSGGEYRVYDKNEKVFEGKIGPQLGGAAFNLRIPVDRLPNKGRMLKVEVQLVEQGSDNGQVLLFHFYHQPYP